MSKYSKAYQEDHNIDWFAIIDGRYYHFASGGTYLPDEVNNKEQNRKLQHFVAQKISIEMIFITVYLLTETILVMFIQSFRTSLKEK